MPQPRYNDSFVVAKHTARRVWERKRVTPVHGETAVAKDSREFIGVKEIDMRGIGGVTGFLRHYRDDTAIRLEILQLLPYQRHGCIA